MAKVKLEDYRGAIADYTRAIEISPKVAKFYLNRADVLKKLAYLDGACLDWSKAGELGINSAYELIKKYCN